MAIKTADRVAAFFEATQLAGFTRAEANRYFGVPRGVPDPLRERLEALDAVSVAAAQAQFLARFNELSRNEELPFFRQHVHWSLSQRLMRPSTERRSIAGRPGPEAAKTRTASSTSAPSARCPTIVARNNASHLLTCLQDDVIVETPAPIQPDRHLRLHIHDIAEPMMGYTAPSGSTWAADRLCARLGRPGAMVVHCWAGISRSTAAAYTACARSTRTCPRS